MTVPILERILAARQKRLAQAMAETPLLVLQEQARRMPPTRKFHYQLLNSVSRSGNAIIAELKQASPSAGRMSGADIDLAQLARTFADAGAACLSVLTEPAFFLGSNDSLALVRDSVPLPILRKDFLTDPYEVYESRVIGADCILLIARILTDDQLVLLERTALSLGLDVLVEIHDRHDLNRIHLVRSRLIGINNRDLSTLETSLHVSETLVRQVPKGCSTVSESGIRSPDDIRRLKRQFINMFLIGESLIRAPDPGALLSDMLAVRRPGPRR